MQGLRSLQSLAPATGWRSFFRPPVAGTTPKTQIVALRAKTCAQRFFGEDWGLARQLATMPITLTSVRTKMAFPASRIAYAGLKFRGGLRYPPAQKSARPKSTTARAKKRAARAKTRVLRSDFPAARTKRAQSAHLFSVSPETQPGAFPGVFSERMYPSLHMPFLIQRLPSSYQTTIL
jgi:hypothetical protein